MIRYHAEHLADIARRLSDLIPTWESGPPMPPMIELGDGTAVSVEALRYFAAAGDDEAARLLAEHDAGPA